MINKYYTRLIMNLDDAIALENLANDFSCACERSGLWARACVELCAVEDDSVIVELDLTINDDMRIKPGPEPKQLAIPLNTMEDMKKAGMSADAIAKRAGISRATVYRRLAQCVPPVEHAY